MGRAAKQASSGTLGKSTSGGWDRRGRRRGDRARHGAARAASVSSPSDQRPSTLPLPSTEALLDMPESLPSLIPRSAPHVRRTDHLRPLPVPRTGSRRPAKAHAPRVTSPPPQEQPTQKPPCLLRPTAGTGNTLGEVRGGKLRVGAREGGYRPFLGNQRVQVLSGPDGQETVRKCLRKCLWVVRRLSNTSERLCPLNNLSDQFQRVHLVTMETKESKETGSGDGEELEVRQNPQAAGTGGAEVQGRHPSA